MIDCGTITVPPLVNPSDLQIVSCGLGGGLVTTVDVGESAEFSVQVSNDAPAPATVSVKWTGPNGEAVATGAAEVPSSRTTEVTSGEVTHQTLRRTLGAGVFDISATITDTGSAAGGPTPRAPAQGGEWR